MVVTWHLLVVLLYAISLHVAFGTSNSQDIAVMQALKSQWSNVPASWNQSTDPCEVPAWDGILCDNNGRITSLRLPGMNITGTLSGDIGQLSELLYLDLSSNRYLTGPLTPEIGNLKQLIFLTLLGCSFTGIIPNEIGHLQNLSHLSINSNNFTGNIPASIGSLSNLYWLDIADNELTGQLPISSDNSPGLDLLVNVKHFHFNKNKLSGPINAQLFSSEMILGHILFDHNNFTGPIPDTLGLVRHLEILRLDNNKFSGTVPTSITNLVSLQELNLANNQLTGPAPDLAPLTMLNSVDLSNNSFNSSTAQTWFTSLSSLTSLAMENGGLTGEIPPKLFTLPQIQQVILDSNKFNGTLDMGSDISPHLVTVNLKNNNIISANINSSYTKSLTLLNNPLCLNTNYANNIYCKEQSANQSQTYSTDMSKCGTLSCQPGKSLSPRSCTCAYPFTGLMYFRAPTFADLTDRENFKELESSLSDQLMLALDSVYLSGISLTREKYVEMNLAIFPRHGEYFLVLEVIEMGFILSNQTFSPPNQFGPYYFIQFAYPFLISESGGKSISKSAIAGIVVVCCVLLITLALVAIYALRLKRKAEEAEHHINPFASWHPHGQNDTNAPQLNSARFFSFGEIKKCTDNFSPNNEIGVGGYGRVYKGILTNGQVVAIKRAEQGSMQGAREFKNEIELLSRVIHKHLVKLLGFCCEQGEQMLVYEYISNGSLRDNLVGGLHLDWEKRIQIALGSAKGLLYLHEHVEPPIIHRDIKSSNILLDENLNAKVADFGISKLMCNNQNISSQVKGTLGYLDPEYYMMHQLSEKSDVYSFGVVMLELITARLPFENGKYIVRVISEAIDPYDLEYYGLRDILDPKILNQEKNIGLILTKFVQLAMECVKDSASNRPSMNEVVKEIENILQNVLNVKFGKMSSWVFDFASPTESPNRPRRDKDPIIWNSSSNKSENSGSHHHIDLSK